MRTKHELSVDMSRSEKSGKLSRGLSCPAGPRFPPVGVAQPLRKEARPGQGWFAKGAGRCQPQRARRSQGQQGPGGAWGWPGLLECMS